MNTQIPLSDSEQKIIDIARQSIEGSQIEYDKERLPTVQIQEGYYIVTFPLQKQQNSSVRTGDFAVQIWIDRHTKEVVKKIIAP